MSKHSDQIDQMKRSIEILGRWLLKVLHLTPKNVSAYLSDVLHSLLVFYYIFVEFF